MAPTCWTMDWRFSFGWRVGPLRTLLPRCLTDLTTRYRLARWVKSQRIEDYDFGPDMIGFLRPQATLPMLQNTFSQQVNGIIGKIRRTRLTMATIYPTLYVVKEDGDPALRMWFLSHMIEDRGDGTLSYAQYLTNLREQVAKIS